MYDNPFQSSNPGLFVILVDQSGSMVSESKKIQEPLAKIAADSINCLIQEIINNATRPYGDDDEIVKNYCKVVVIGYGAEKDNPIQIICSENLPDLAEKWSSEKTKTVFGDLMLRNFVKPVAGAVTPMEAAFKEAYDQIEKWAMEGHNGAKDPSPVIINITDGAPTNDEGYVTENAVLGTADAVQKIFDIKSFPDGAPVVFNIMLNTESTDEVHYPESDTVFADDDFFARFLFVISSKITDRMLNVMKSKGMNVSAESRGMMMNVNDPYQLVEFLKMGTLPKMMR